MEEYQRIIDHWWFTEFPLPTDEDTFRALNDLASDRQYLVEYNDDGDGVYLVEYEEENR